MQSPPQAIIRQGDRSFYTEDIDHIRCIAKRYAHLSHTEVIYTLCETLKWLTPSGNPKRQACTKLVSRLQADGIVEFPALKENYRHHREPTKTTPISQALTDSGELIEMKLAALGRVSLKLITEKEEKALCNAYLQRYHYLGYKKPFGYRQRYWIESTHERFRSRKLGCIILGGRRKIDQSTRSMDWLERSTAPQKSPLGSQQHPFSYFSLGQGSQSCQPSTGSAS